MVQDHLVLPCFSPGIHFSKRVLVPFIGESHLLKKCVASDPAFMLLNGYKLLYEVPES